MKQLRQNKWAKHLEVYKFFDSMSDEDGAEIDLGEISDTHNDHSPLDLQTGATMEIFHPYNFHESEEDCNGNGGEREWQTKSSELIDGLDNDVQQQTRTLASDIKSLGSNKNLH
jgi:hypothetical protein